MGWMFEYSKNSGNVCGNVAWAEAAEDDESGDESTTCVSSARAVGRLQGVHRCVAMSAVG